MQCLNIKNKEVKVALDELTQVLGSYDAAYYVISENNGYGLDKAPNGADSKLFKDLLSNYNGDRNKALIAKTKVYSDSFRSWFGDWLSDSKTNVSKVVDENGEPLVVYHGGAKNIKEFMHSTDTNSNTGFGTYADKKTGEKVEVDSNNAMFFSNNKHVGTSYAQMYAVLEINKLYPKIESLLDTTGNGELDVSKKIFKDLDNFFNSLDEFSKFNPRFKKFKDYLKYSKSIGKRLNRDEVDAFRNMLINVREELKKYTDSTNLNYGDWLYVLNKTNKILNLYNCKEGVLRLIEGEIPIEMLKEFELYKKIEENRRTLNRSKINNYDLVHFALSNSKRYYFIYDGKKLSIWDENYKDYDVKNMSQEQLSLFIKRALDSNKDDLERIKSSNTVKKLNEYSQEYPVFLNIKKPLEHDYEGTHQGQGYKESKKYPFGYVAGRQVKKALSNGNDGVVYKNLYDPFLADNYGVFNSNQIKSVDNRSTFSKEDNNIYNSPYSEELMRSTDRAKLYKSLMFTDTIDNASTALSVLNNIRNNMSDVMTDFQLEILDKFNIDLESIPVEVVTDRLLDYSMQLVVSKDGVKILINNNIFSTLTKAKIVSDFLHELTHYKTVSEYDSNPTFRAKIDKLYETTKSYYPDVNTDGGLYYGLSSPKEFISEIYTNGQFRDEVMRADRKSGSMWLKFIKAIAKLFKLDATTRVINNISDLVSNRKNKPVYELYAKYNMSTFEKYGLDLHKINVDNLIKKLNKGLNARYKSLRSLNYPPLLLNKIQQLIKDYEDLIKKNEDKSVLIDFILRANEAFTPALTKMREAIKDPSLINTAQLEQFKNDFLDFYGPLILDIDKLLVQLGYFDDLQPDFKDMLLQRMNNINRAYNELNGKYITLLKEKAASIIDLYGSKYGFKHEDIASYLLNDLNKTDGDISMLNLILLSTMSNKDMAIRIMHTMMLDINNSVSRFANNKAQELIRDFNNISLELTQLYYEKDKNGKPTGNLVRDLNYGQMRKDMHDFLVELDSKYGVVDNKYEDLEEEDYYYYLIEKEKWLADHVERKFKPEYYSAYNYLSPRTRRKLDDVDVEINTILLEVIEEDGPHLEKLTNLLWNNLDSLYNIKRNLANKYYSNGELKVGDDLDVANELIDFYEKIGNGKIKSKTYTNEEIEAIMKSKEATMSPETYNKWLKRNISYQYTQEFIELLANLEKANLGADLEEYDRLNKKKKELLKLAKNNNAPNTEAYKLEVRTKQKIKEIDELLNYIRSKHRGHKSRFLDIAKVVKTNEYNVDYAKAKAAGKDVFDKWYKENHLSNGRPVSYYTMIVPKSKKHYELRLSLMNKEFDKTSELVNKNYNFSNPEYYQPKRSLYDNTKAYKEATKTDEQKYVYNKIASTMEEANSKLTFIQKSDKFKLPLMTGDLVDFTCRGNKFFKGIMKYSLDGMVVKADDKEFSLDDFTLKANGDELMFVPTHYVKALENPEYISRNLVGMLTEYARMAENYNQKVLHQADFETINSMLLNREVTVKNNELHTKKEEKGEKSRIRLKYEEFLKMQLYGLFRKPGSFRFLGIDWSFTKMLGGIKNYATVSNLSWNLAAIGKGYLQGTYKSFVEAVAGRYFSLGNYTRNVGRNIKNLFVLLPNLGNALHNNYEMAIMEHNEIAREVSSKVDMMQYNRGIRTTLKNLFWGGWSIIDYVVKAPVVRAIYADYKYIPSEKQIMPKRVYILKFYPGKWKEGSKAFDNIESFTMDDVYEVKNGVLTIKSKYNEYKDAISSPDVANSIRNLSRFLTNRIDGILSLEDKSSYMTNAVGAAILMHRSFFINNLQDNILTNRLYNPTIQDEYEAKYRSTFNGITQLAKNLLSRYNLIKNSETNTRKIDDLLSYNMKRVGLQLSMIIVNALLVALLLKPMVDDDDDNWLKQYFGYIVAGTNFEEKAEYNPLDFWNLIKSPSAAIAPVENVTNALKLLNPLFSDYYWSDETITKGPYKDMERYLKTLIKTVPGLRGIWESRDMKSKWEYLDSLLDK